MCMTNPLLNLGFKIPFDQIKPEHAEPAVDALLEQAQHHIAELAQARDASFLDRFDTLTEQLDTVNTIVHHLDSVCSSDEWKAAVEAILPKVSQFFTELSLNEDLWKALNHYSENHAAGIDPVRARYLKLSIDSFKRGGIDLPEDKKARLMELNTELAKVTNQFAKNVLEGTAAYELYVSTERMEGVPERVKEATRRAAEERGKEGHRLTLHQPTFFPILTYADDRELRRELWEANALLGQEEGRDNRPLVTDILKLRREQARLLGFDHFSDLVLQERMAKTGEKALAFERDLEAKTRPSFEREVQELEAYYREKVGENAPKLQPWDIGYWAEKQRQEKYDFDAEELRPYFEMNRVLEGMFEITHRIFGITVTESEAPGWHPEVKYYTIHNEAGEHVASFYTDWFPRDSKRGGAWMNAFITGGEKEGGFEPHLGLMCGNMTPPSGDTPSLLSIDEVETVFHEFGHLLHHALSRVPVKSLSGTNVPWDFVELPSQIMENWVMEREALDLFARHYKTGEALPDELFQKLVAAKNYRAAHFAMRQYSFGQTDLALHVEFDPETGDPIAYAREMMARFMPTELPENYAQIASFNHLFSSPVGYGSGYYSYKWAEVLDADAFSRFAKEGIFNRETGRSYVDTILSRGNSEDPAQLYRNFMGRDPEVNAVLRRSGLL